MSHTGDPVFLEMVVPSIHAGNVQVHATWIVKPHDQKGRALFFKSKSIVHMGKGKRDKRDKNGEETDAHPGTCNNGIVLVACSPWSVHRLAPLCGVSGQADIVLVRGSRAERA